jgi:hypothetical protein
MSVKVIRKPIECSKLATVDENIDPTMYASHFVRVLPTVNASDEQLKELKRELEQAGASAVRLMPRPRGNSVQLGGAAQTVKLLMGPGDAIPPVRELVSSLVASSVSNRKAELEELLMKLADEEGL